MKKNNVFLSASEAKEYISVRQLRREKIANKEEILIQKRNHTAVVLTTTILPVGFSCNLMHTYIKLNVNSIDLMTAKLKFSLQILSLKSTKRHVVKTSQWSFIYQVKRCVFCTPN